MGGTKEEGKKRHLGRYPFAAGIDYFVQKRTPYCAPLTVAEEARKLRYFDRVFRDLSSQGKVKTTDPRHMSREDIEAFLVWMKSKDLGTIARVKYLQILDHYLTVWGNDVVSSMKDDHDLNLPRDTCNAPIRALSVEDLQRILDSTYKIGGWNGQLIRGLIALGFGTGCRPKELFNALTEDVDLVQRRFYVRHPKGEGSWGTPQWIPIVRGDMVPYLEELLDARKGLDTGPGVSPYLFACEGANRPVCANTLRRLKARTEALTGIRWMIKDLRSTLASLTVEGDVTHMKAVSLQLRHASVKTTEKYYARISAAEEIEKSIGTVWEKNPVKFQKQ